MKSYQDFLRDKQILFQGDGFEPNETVYPLQLFDFQKKIVTWNCLKGRSLDAADCGLGKGQPYGSLILTENGFKKNTDIKIGDMIIASDGKSYPLSGVYYKPEQDTWRIFFSDNTSFVVDSDHLHIVRTNNDRQRHKKWRILSTKDLLECENLRYGKNCKSRNYDIPIVSPVEFVQQEFYIRPYLLGVLIGDGYLNGNISISSSDDEILMRCQLELPENIFLKRKSKYDWNIKTGYTGTKQHPFRSELEKMGLLGKKSHEKFIPDIYKVSSISSRLDLLRGLMDTDGFIDKKCGTCQFYTTSKKLSEDILDLIQGLGGIPTHSMKKTSLNGKRKRDCYVVTFSLKTFNPFYLSRKAQYWNKFPRDNGRWIDKIEYEKRQKTICITVDSPDSSYVTNAYIVTHNTPIQLTVADQVARHTGKRVLILTPLAVSFQTVLEGEKFGIEVTHRREGIKNGDRLVVTNYERLHYFHPDDFGMIVCDESSILKNFDGIRRKQITEFMRNIPYRLLCTATAAPNDYPELGTSSEALGIMGFTDMLNRYFEKMNKSYTRREQYDLATFRFRPHAEKRFWRWVCSWTRALRKPSDMGYDDDGFILPKLSMQQHIVKAKTLPDGWLFEVPAVGRKEENNELKRTVQERCEKAAELILAHKNLAVAWCYRNKEGELLQKLIPNSVNVEGKDPEEKKEEDFKNFRNGNIRVLITKPKIACFGMNWQHCAHTTFFPSHSYEQFYQAIRRFWRFGQTQSVQVDIISTEGQQRVLKNLLTKEKKANKQFDMLIQYMHEGVSHEPQTRYTQQEELPSWL